MYSQSHLGSCSEIFPAQSQEPTDPLWAGPGPVIVMTGFHLDTQIFQSGKFTSFNLKFFFSSLFSLWSTLHQILDLLICSSIILILSSMFFSYFETKFLETSLTLSFDTITVFFVLPDVYIFTFQVFILFYCYVFRASWFLFYESNTSSNNNL